MSQYVSRIYIEVKKSRDWEKLSDLNLIQYGLWDDALKELSENCFYIDGDWSCFEGPLFNLVFEISSILPDCIIFADTNNINVDPYNYIIYYLGDRVKTKYFDGNMQEETSLAEPLEWFRQHKIRLGKNQKEYLKSFNFE